MSLAATDAVMLMAHGGPQTLEEIPAFLSHIRGGRPISEAFMAEVIERYRLVGGSSPLVPICESLASGLEKATGKPVYIGMRHTAPFIDETLARISNDGHRKVLGICLAPHFSGLSIGKYHQAAIEASSRLSQALELRLVKSWGALPKFVDYHVQEIRRLLTDDGSQTRVLLTAHSLPSRILNDGDPYVDQLEETRRHIAAALGTAAEPLLVFQSASPSPEPWLSPSLEQTLEQLASKGVKNIIISPIGFVADNIEILYDIDIAVQDKAKTVGVAVTRSRMLNDKVQMVAILSDIVEQSGMEQTRA